MPSNPYQLKQKVTAVKGLIQNGQISSLDAFYKAFNYIIKAAEITMIQAAIMKKQY